MREVVKIKNVVIGEGMPKICVSITGTTKEEILEQAAVIVEKQPDLLEWRFDCFGSVFSEEAEKILQELAEILRQIPLIFTFRTAEEGGNREISTADYIELLHRISEYEEIAVVDVEQQKADSSLIERLHTAGRKVIASRHYFTYTPSNEEMESVFEAMEALHADILKLAVMPEDYADVVRLMETTRKMSEKCSRPLVSMAMGTIGAVSRICGEQTGSSITFGAVGQTSAPGQIPISELSSFLKLLHR